MKKTVVSIFLLSLAGLIALTACGPRVVIESLPPAAAETSPATTRPRPTPAPTLTVTLSPATTAVPTPALPTETRPTSASTVSPAVGKPSIVVQSDEIVPIPPNLLKDLNTTLDDLIASINSLEAPSEDALTFP